MPTLQIRLYLYGMMSNWHTKVSRILFAISASSLARTRAECTNLEWTRRKVDINELNNIYYPIDPNNPAYSRGLVQKWKEIPSDLYAAHKISKETELDLSKLGTLVKRYRNGIIHAHGSRPLTDDLQGKSKPFPTKKDLQDLEPGWAIEIASELVAELCETLGEPKPDYFK
jgi:hypothetical protein